MQRGRTSLRECSGGAELTSALDGHGVASALHVSVPVALAQPLPVTPHRVVDHVTRRVRVLLLETTLLLAEQTPAARRLRSRCRCTTHTRSGWPQSRRKKSSSLPGFSRAINLLFHRLSQQKVNAIMTFIKGYSISTPEM